MDGLVDHAFTAAQLARLAAVGELLDPVPLDTFEGERAAATLAGTDVLVGHWGCPTLTADVLALAPRLALFAYAAGTVKWQVTDAVWAARHHGHVGRSGERGPGRGVHRRDAPARGQGCAAVPGVDARPVGRAAVEPRDRRQLPAPDRDHRRVARRTTGRRAAPALRSGRRGVRPVPHRRRRRPPRCGEGRRPRRALRVGGCALAPRAGRRGDAWDDRCRAARGAPGRRDVREHSPARARRPGRAGGRGALGPHRRDPRRDRSRAAPGRPPAARVPRTCS